MRKSNHFSALFLVISLAASLFLTTAFYLPVSAENASAEDTPAQTKTLRIIGTSDLHGKFAPWDYALNAENFSGSMAQLSSAIQEYRTGNTLLVDAGDTIQDNCADIFLESQDVHPMVQAINYLNYDVWVTGNHDYNYGMDVMKKTIADLNCRVLTGNVYDENKDPVADSHAIFDIDGVRVAVIGMVTPNILKWDRVNLKDYTVTDPLDETRKIINEFEGQYDVLVGVFHMGLKNELDLPNSGVTDILEACPEFDVMISSHEHARIPGEEINGVLVVQNKEMAQTMAVIDLTLEKSGDGWKIANISSESIEIADYEPDPALSRLLARYDEYAKENAKKVIAILQDGTLVPENEVAQIPAAQIQDTALIDLVNKVQMYYSSASVSSAALLDLEANLDPGVIRKSDLSLIYKFSNSLYKLLMTGKQLRKYMEWSASYYNTLEPGDLTISFDPDIRAYNYDMFEGVNYEVNISREAGNRIENLTWPDGTPVEDDDVFDIAVNNYRAESQLLTPGEIYEEDDMPTLLESDVRSDIGGIRELIGDYIVNVMGGTIEPDVNNNWKITGINWDPEFHEKAVEMVSNGEIIIPASQDGRTPNARSVTEEDVFKYAGGVLER